MIHYETSDLFKSRAHTLVNAVNCVGVMGAGIAYQFKTRFPKMYEDYVDKCKQYKVRVGKPYLYQELDMGVSILNFPTKVHWKHPSELGYIKNGLKYFVKKFPRWDIQSIAFPALGCGKGGLDWEEVRPIMELYLEPISNLIPVYIFLPNSH